MHISLSEFKMLLGTDQSGRPLYPNLYKFIIEFYKYLKSNNQTRVSHNKPEEKAILDTKSRILVGDEKCVSVAVSKGNLLITSNNINHYKDQVSFHVTAKIEAIELESKDENLPYRSYFEVVYTCWYNYFQYDPKKHRMVLKHEDTISTPPMRYVSAPLQPYRLFGNTEYIFSFTKQKHKIEHIDESINYHVTLLDIWPETYIPNVGYNFVVHQRFYTYLNPLLRRIAKIGQQLALAVHAYNYPEYRAKISTILNKTRAKILSDSLSYQLSGFGCYKAYIKPYDFSHKGASLLHEFYTKLINNYEEYKKLKKIDFDTIASIQNWWKENVERGIIENLELETPGFIKQNPRDFLELGFRYFKDLIRLEMFAYVDAARQGQLAKILENFNPLESEIPVEIIDEGEEGFHAEMRLLSYHLSRNLPTTEYFGITKLCCGMCNLVMQQFKLADYRGTHTAIFGNWLFGSELIKPQYLSILLRPIYNLYQELEQQPDINIPNKGRVSQAKVALFMIESLATINRTEALKDINIEPDLLLPNATDFMMYPPEDDHIAICDTFNQLVKPDQSHAKQTIEANKHLQFATLRSGYLLPNPPVEYNLTGRKAIGDTTIITLLKRKTNLQFFGVCDNDYYVDALLEITNNGVRDKANMVKQTLNYGRFFQANDQRTYYILERINVRDNAEGLQHRIKSMITLKR